MSYILRALFVRLLYVFTIDIGSMVNSLGQQYWTRQTYKVLYICLCWYMLWSEAVFQEQQLLFVHNLFTSLDLYAFNYFDRNVSLRTNSKGNENAMFIWLLLMFSDIKLTVIRFDYWIIHKVTQVVYNYHMMNLHHFFFLEVFWRLLDKQSVCLYLLFWCEQSNIAMWWSMFHIVVAVSFLFNGFENILSTRPLSGRDTSVIHCSHVKLYLNTGCTNWDHP